MYSSITKESQAVLFYDHLIYDDFVLLGGVESARFSYSISKQNLNVLGAQTSGMIMNGPVEVSASLSKSLAVSDNYLLQHTGRADLKLHFSTQYNALSLNGITITGAAIDSFSVSSAAGEVPKVSVDFICADNSFYEAAASSDLADEEALSYVPATGIQLNIGGQNGFNVVSSADFSVKFNWIKESVVKSAGSSKRFMLELVRPIEYQASVELTLDNYMVDSFSFNNPKTWELKIYSDTGLLYTFTMDNAELIGESLSLNNQGAPSVSLQYKGVG